MIEEGPINPYSEEWQDVDGPSNEVGAGTHYEQPAGPEAISDDVFRTVEDVKQIDPDDVMEIGRNPN